MPKTSPIRPDVLLEHRHIQTDRHGAIASTTLVHRRAGKKHRLNCTGLYRIFVPANTLGDSDVILFQLIFAGVCRHLVGKMFDTVIALKYSLLTVSDHMDIFLK